MIKRYPAISLTYIPPKLLTRKNTIFLKGFDYVLYECLQNSVYKVFERGKRLYMGKKMKFYGKLKRDKRE